MVVLAVINLIGSKDLFQHNAIRDKTLGNLPVESLSKSDRSCAGLFLKYKSSTVLSGLLKLFSVVIVIKRKTKLLSMMQGIL